jgi:hypothetical protein
MKTSPAELEKWNRLYQLMDELKELAPWEWMDEVDIFGVQNPVKDEISFVSIMGQLGKHYAVAVYLGAEGLYGFWDMQDAGPDLQYEALLEVPQLQASFENKNMLQPQDKKIINELGLLYRGQNSWPFFRAYHPGFFPWFLQEDERDFLITVLEQCIQVTKRSLDDPALLEPRVDERYLVRVLQSKSGKLEWQDQWLTIPPPWSKPLSPSLDPKTVSAMTSMPVRDLTVEIDLFNTGMVIQDKGRRPHFAHLLLTVDQKTGFVLSNNLLSPLPSLEAMWESVPQKVIENLVKLDLRPQQVLVKEGLMYQLLLVLSKKTDLPVVAVKNLPSINAARQHLMKSKQR